MSLQNRLLFSILTRACLLLSLSCTLAEYDDFIGLQEDVSMSEATEDLEIAKKDIADAIETIKFLKALKASKASKSTQNMPKQHTKIEDQKALEVLETIQKNINSALITLSHSQLDPLSRIQYTASVKEAAEQELQILLDLNMEQKSGSEHRDAIENEATQVTEIATESTEIALESLNFLLELDS